MREVIRKTRSLCPVCRRNIPAELIRDTDSGYIYMYKNCPQHGESSALIWRGRMDFEKWTEGADELTDHKGENCPSGCGLCEEHEQGTCCVVLEVTKRCNLRCRFCFADGGSGQDRPLEDIKEDIRNIVRLAGSPTIQISGGEPTLREDLPEIVGFAREQGCAFVQLNSNGIRLAEDEGLVEELAEAGLDYVFMQFDGFSQDVYEKLRGADLLEKKKDAIKMCDRYGIGVTLVPAIVRGVNDSEIGEIVRFAAANVPAVRGVHFQPVSYFGRIPEEPEEDDRYTLDELIYDICDQAGLEPGGFVPSRCDHPLCGFHCSFAGMPDGSLYPVSGPASSGCGITPAARNRDYIGGRWKRADRKALQGGKLRPGADLRMKPADEPVDFDTFVESMRSRSFTLTAMAFHDKENINVERLIRCSLHVYEEGKLIPFCLKYILDE